ncbi:hypothetical protein WMF27_13275 [Sorangium sp. So ce281]|uniref:DUF7948 domain-containing protein n=1 Tax=unclassified Sorangium TaxID=2621164 RepID=UPI003F5FC30D
MRLEFERHRAGVVPEGKDPTGAVVSYFTGPREPWRTGVPTYAAVVYEDLWPGVDLEISGTAHALKCELVVAPGAVPAQIRLTYRGASAVRLTEGGQVEISTPAPSRVRHRPETYVRQPIRGPTSAGNIRSANHLYSDIDRKHTIYDPFTVLVL